MIIKSSKLSEVKAELARLEIGKAYSVQEIIDTIKQVCNHKSKSADSFNFVSEQYNGLTIGLEDLWVDMTYQRRIRLAKIINKLIKVGGFDKDIAGTIDIAYRPCEDRNYVWDGFRRCLMVGMCGGERIAASTYRHPSNLRKDECRAIEARYFQIRNSFGEKMTFEELFKSRVAYGEKRALAMLSLLKECGLDVEDLNPAGVVLGGLKSFDEIFGKIDEAIIIEAAELYLHAWNNESQVSSYALCGLATLMELDEFSNSYTIDEVREMLRKYALTNKPRELTSVRLNNAAFDSIAFNFATKVLNDKNGLVDELLSEEQQNMLKQAA